LKVATDGEDVWRSVREYQAVSARVKVGDSQFQPTLPPEHRLIAVEAAKQAALLFSPRDNLTRDELDAIDVQANSLFLDRLLPPEPVAVGASWPHAEELLAAMLGLDEVAKSTVKSTLTEVTDKKALFQFSGHVDGAIDGASTDIELKGKYRFDRQTNRVNWLAMLVKEDRQSGFIADGLDVKVRLQMTIDPVPQPAGLSEAALAKLTLKPTPSLTALRYQSPGAQWRCRHDRRWYVHSQRPNDSVAVLRMVDRGMLTGQCNLSSPARRDPDKLISLKAFQDGVQEALGDNFGEFVEAGESSHEAGYRVYRVVVQGTASDIAMRWIYHLVADPSSGQQAALTFAVEQSLLDRFADADKAIVASVRFAEKKDQKNDTESTERKTPTAEDAKDAEK
jgi:hypothetical protein